MPSALPDPKVSPAIYLATAALQDGPIRDRTVGAFAVRPLQDQCVEAASEALSAVPALRHQVEAVYFGSMGILQSRPRMRLHPNHIPNHLRTELGLEHLRSDRRDGTALHAPWGTSESGAFALLRAVRDLQAGRHETVLVVAGEQMFSVTEGLDPEAAEVQRRQDRADNASWIRSVVDPLEADGYGMTMLSVGDLLLDHAAWLSGYPEATWRALIETVTLAKYEYAAMYPRAMQPAKELERPDTWITAERYRGTPLTTPWYRLHDVGAPSNGATAVVLTTNRGLAEASAIGGARLIRLLGMGEGHTRVALAGRTGPLHRHSAIRRALRSLCHDAEVLPALLTDERSTRGILHDAFPAIELAFLTELAATLDPRLPPEAGRAWILERFLSGIGNPLGGLCASGHALGNSGLFQIAKAFHAMTRARDYLVPHPRGTYCVEDFDRPFFVTTSVGSALTNVLATLVVRESDEATALLSDARAGYAAQVDAIDDGPLRAPRHTPRYLEGVTLDAGCGVVAARTRTLGPERRWVLGIRTGEGNRLARWAGDVPPEHGDLVALASVEGPMRKPVLDATGVVGRGVLSRAEATPAALAALESAIADVRARRLSYRESPPGPAPVSDGPPRNC